MISSSSSVVSHIFSIGVKLTSKFTSLEEPTNDSDIAADMVFSVDGIEPREPMRKFRLPNVRSIS
jgi:hypothetical protein